MDEHRIELIEKRFAKLKVRPELADFFSHLDKIRDLSVQEKEFLVDQFRWADQKINFPELWISETLTVANKIAQGHAEYVEFGMFFIRLHGILTEFPNHFKQVNQDFAKLFPKNENLAESVKLNEAIIEEVASLSAQFSEIEKLTIEFIRNQQAHVFPGKYQIQQKRDGTFKRTHGEVDPIMARVDEVVLFLNTFRQDHHLYATSIAPRSIPYLQMLRELIRRKSSLALTLV